MLGAWWAMWIGLFAPPGATHAPALDLERAHARWEGTSAVRVLDDDPSALEWVRERALDDWGDWGPSRDLVISHETRAELDARHITYALLVDDLAQAARRERTRIEQSPRPRSPLDPTFFDEFRDLDALESAWAAIRDAHPQEVALSEIGRSVESRPIFALRIGSGQADKRVVYIFGQHAREWISPATATCVAQRWASDEGQANQELLANLDIWLVPLANPDGYAHTWSEDRFWRKNRRDGLGVDLNRNWSVGFGLEPGSSGDPESNNHRGPYPFSEPETRTLRDLVEALPSVDAFVDIHAYSQLVLYPPSLVSPLVLEGRGEMQAWAHAIAAQMHAVEGVDYTPMRGIDLYPASGVAMDWGHGDDATPSFTLELRPSGDIEFPEGFILPPEQIRPTCEETFAALDAIARWTLEGGPPQTQPPPSGGEDGGGEDGGSEDGGEGGTGGEGETGSGDAGGSDLTSGTSGGPDAATETLRSGCACSARPGAPGPGAPLALMLLAARRRRLKGDR